MNNVPDDWNDHYRKCGDCGSRYHASEGGCDCYEEQAERAATEAAEEAGDFLPGCATVDGAGMVIDIRILLDADFSDDHEAATRNTVGLAEELASLLESYGAAFCPSVETHQPNEGE